MTSQQVAWWTIDQHVASTLDAVGDWPILIRRGRAVTESGEHTPPRGEYLGTINHWGLDVHENSPPEWIDLLLAEEP